MKQETTTQRQVHDKAADILSESSSLIVAPTAEECRLTREIVHKQSRFLVELYQEKKLQSSYTMGSELEYVLVNKDAFPVDLAHSLLTSDKDLRADLSQYNVESGSLPTVLGPNALRDLYQQTEVAYRNVKKRAEDAGASVALAGILPTYHLAHFNPEMFVSRRYREINAGILAQREDLHFELDLSGEESLKFSFPTILIEALNTSFQLHLQVPPENLKETYNNLQAFSAVVLACAANSSLVFSTLSCAEARIPIWEQATLGEVSRVPFGDDWIKSPLEPLLAVGDYDPIIVNRDLLAKYKVNPDLILQDPQLTVLAEQNGTLWRWNRLCFGNHAGETHIRIESRFLPAGPSVVDMIANAAFFYGLALGFPKYLEEQHAAGSIEQLISFSRVKENFYSAVQHGLLAPLTWFNDRGEEITCSAANLALDLLPVAEAGLRSINMASEEFSSYLNIIKERLETKQNGAEWMRNRFKNYLAKGLSRREATLAVTRDMLKNQSENLPVHKWDIE